MLVYCPVAGCDILGGWGMENNTFETGLDSQHRNCNCKDPHCSTAGLLLFCNVIYWTVTHSMNLPCIHLSTWKTMFLLCLLLFYNVSFYCLWKEQNLWKDYLASAAEDEKSYQKTPDWNRLLPQCFSSTLKHPALIGFSSSQWHHSNTGGVSRAVV